MNPNGYWLTTDCSDSTKNHGSAPLATRVAPVWNLKNNQMWYSIINELKRRGSWQGCRLDVGCVKAAAGEW
jgi:radical SAM superfamily enzyme